MDGQEKCHPPSLVYYPEISPLKQLSDPTQNMHMRLSVPCCDHMHP